MALSILEGMQVPSDSPMLHFASLFMTVVVGLSKVKTNKRSHCVRSLRFLLPTRCFRHLQLQEAALSALFSNYIFCVILCYKNIEMSDFRDDTVDSLLDSWNLSCYKATFQGT